MKIAGENIKTIDILQKENTEQWLKNVMEGIKFPQELINYIRTNNWISIPNKNLYFNKDVMACYPNFNFNFQNIQINTSDTLENVYKRIKSNAEYSKYGIDWDIATLGEINTSFYRKNHPMDNGSYNHYIKGMNYILYNDALSGKLNARELYYQNNTYSGFLVPIYRIGNGIDHKLSYMSGAYMNYSPETILLLFVLNEFIPDFGNKLNEKYEELSKNIIEKVKQYVISTKKTDVDMLAINDKNGLINNIDTVFYSGSFIQFIESFLSGTKELSEYWDLRDRQIVEIDNSGLRTSSKINNVLKKIEAKKEIETKLRIMKKTAEKINFKTHTYVIDSKKIEGIIKNGDPEGKFGKNRIRYILENGDQAEIELNNGKVTYGEYIFANKDKEICLFERDQNGNFIKNGQSKIEKYNKELHKLLVYKDWKPEGESEYAYLNEDKEIFSYESGKRNGAAEYHYKNGDKEKFNYKNDIRDGKSEYAYSNGDKETFNYKNDVRDGKSEYAYSNGDKEIFSYVSGKRNGAAEYHYKNGDKEKFNYKNDIRDGKSEYKYKNGDSEVRNYTNGKIVGEAVYNFANGDYPARYVYQDGKKKDITVLYKVLNVDKIRVNLGSYDENILTDPNRGHWDIFGVTDLSNLEEALERKAYGRDAHLDIKYGGIVGIDFGTKSTVVVFQDDSNKTFPMRISGNTLNKGVQDSDYENPTVIEFKNLEKFMREYTEIEGRPFTKWEDVTVSHTAFQNLINGTSGDFNSAISDLKQWAGTKDEKIVIRDKKGLEKVFPAYLDLDEDEVDPIELYAYYIGSYINNMVNGIYLEYLLSFPVTYEKKIRDKILNSFKRGIKKSFPEAILDDEKVMERFKVIHGANEPAAYATCALQEYDFEPDEGEKVYYGVFDFGGGTADFDFGIWELSEDERSYDYTLTHFGAGGDRYLGGENILKELAYDVLKDNQDTLRALNISFARPVWCERFIGDEGLIDNSPEAKLNIKMLMEKLRAVWEKTDEASNIDGKMKIALYKKNGELVSGIEIEVDKDKIEAIIENKIDRGVENFFIAMKKVLGNETVDKVNILLAGNSCKHPKVMELFNKRVTDSGLNIEIFPALGTSQAYAKLKERGIEVDENDKTKPTGKTGVAYGIIDSRIGGRIEVKNKDENNNINNEINFKYYVGYEGRKKLKVILTPQSEYEQFIYFLNVTGQMFDLYYTTLPEAMDSKMLTVKAKRERVLLKKDYPGAKIYIKAVSPDTIAYVVTEKPVEDKEYLEEGKIKLN